jgi:hypothetical protein
MENKNKFNGTSSHRNIQPLNDDQNELPTKETYELFQPVNYNLNIISFFVLFYLAIKLCNRFIRNYEYLTFIYISNNDQIFNN